MSASDNAKKLYKQLLCTNLILTSLHFWLNLKSFSKETAVLLIKVSWSKNFFHSLLSIFDRLQSFTLLQQLQNCRSLDPWQQAHSELSLHRHVRHVIECAEEGVPIKIKNLSFFQSFLPFSGHLKKAIQLPFGSRKSENPHVPINKDWTIHPSCKKATSKVTSVKEYYSHLPS